MKQSRDLILSFDYELFLGKRSGSATKCIIEPTNALLTILKKHKAKSVFFVDTMYLSKLKDLAELNEDYERIKIQLLSIFKEGHFVFPHIHPHWIDAVFLKSELQFDLSDLSRYSLSKLSRVEAVKLFTEAFNILNEMGINYKAYGYRAGGWCIQPFRNYKEIFLENNILSEFSVLPGCQNDSVTQKYNFSMIANKVPYRFSDEVELPVIDGIFNEFPISMININMPSVLMDRLVKKYLWKSGDTSWGDGLSANTASMKKTKRNEEMISIDIFTIAKINQYKKYLNNNSYMHWISHPKMFTKHGLKMFDKFLEYSNSRFNIEYDFNKMI